MQVELAEVLLHQSKFAEAIEVLDGITPKPEEPAGRVTSRAAIRAGALRGLGRKDEAAALLDRTIAAHPNPDAGAIYRIRGQLYLDDNNGPEAVRCLEKAVALSPAHHQSHYLLSQAYAAVGHPLKFEAQQDWLRFQRQEPAGEKK